ncbi:hypothetical protein KUTeg_010726 [Tegillarca granosa]|uniref:Uncharacterized protein n=1 Tax=Tegillarca granosa TaxID=220873 RepID=A0ABQ9F469_TEGGR|nr:hypothetical protein KUTeg_010726 [Tegillarca granosa]
MMSLLKQKEVDPSKEILDNELNRLQSKRNLTDGPVSLQDSFNGSTMDADTGQSGKSKDGKSTNQMQKSFSLCSQNEAQNQNQNHAEMNGDVEWEELLNVKNLKEDVLLPKCKKIVEALQKVEEFDRGDAMRLIKSIEVGMKMLKELNSKGIFKNDSIWFPSYYALNGIWNFTDASLLLAKRIAEADGVKFFTANCSHKPYLDALQNKNVYYVVKSSMCIIHNIARTTGVHQYFKENKTTDIIDAGALPVFLNMLKSDNEEDQAMTARAIWTLAFDKDVLQSITQYEEMMPTLEKLKDSPNKDVQKNVSGALFVLKGENDVSNRKYKMCVPSMAMFDGKLLCQLKRMKTEAPEFYYQSLEKRLGMSLVEILTFTAALDKL